MSIDRSPLILDDGQRVHGTYLTWSAIWTDSDPVFHVPSWKWDWEAPDGEVFESWRAATEAGHEVASLVHRHRAICGLVVYATTGDGPTYRVLVDRDCLPPAVARTFARPCRRCLR